MPYSKIKLVSFDLDNTLYDNGPVIKLAEQKSQDFLRSEFTRQGQIFDYQKFLHFRNELISSESDLQLADKSHYENLSFLRLQVLTKCCGHLENSKAIVDEALEIFLNYRNSVLIEEQMISMLRRLSQNYTIVSVTNGNCDAAQLTIAESFSKNYSPVQGFRAKPHPQMLEQIFKDFELRPEQVLHIGDQMDSDAQAAKNSGCVFRLFAPFVDDIDVAKSCDQLISELIDN